MPHLSVVWYSGRHCFRQGSLIHLPDVEILFFSALGVSMSLSSGYHPQSNSPTLETMRRCVGAHSPGSSVENELAVPSVRANLHCCRRVWKPVVSFLTRAYSLTSTETTRRNQEECWWGDCQDPVWSWGFPFISFLFFVHRGEPGVC